MTLSVPEPLRDYHDLSEFDCGEESLNRWLRKRARRNAADDASRTFVVCSGAQVVAYYSLSAGGISHTDAPSKLRRNMPDPIPVMLLGRLAVDRNWQKQGIGQGLLRDALLRCLAVREQAGLKAMMVHAVDQAARGFYVQAGFTESPSNKMTLFVSLRQAEAMLRQQL